MSNYSDFPWHVCDVIPHFTGALSMFGSGWIMCEVLLDKKKQRMTYHRIMFALSFFDFPLSFWSFMGKWAQAGSALATNPIGTIGTCNASGFFIYLGSLTIPAYNCMLSTYYYLTINRNWREQRLWKSFEIYCHPIIISLCIAIAIAPIPLELYNPWFFYCFTVHIDSRGSKFWGDCFRLLYLIVVFTVMIVNVCIFGSIYLQYRKTIRQSKRWQMSSHLNSTHTLSPDDPPASQDKGKFFSFFNKKWRSSTRMQREIHEHESVEKKRSRSVLIMALLYIFPFTITWFIPVVIFLFTRLYWHDKLQFPPFRAQFVGQVYVSTAMPLQGFFNWIIYMRPRYLKYRKKMSSFVDFVIVLKQVFGRILNRADSENDEDWLLGSGFEVVEFEEEQPQISSDTQLATPHQKSDQSIDSVGGENEKGNLKSCNKPSEPGQEDDQSINSICRENEEVNVEIFDKSELPEPNQEDDQRVDAVHREMKKKILSNK